MEKSRWSMGCWMHHQLRFINLLLNIRAEGDPATLRRIVEQQLAKLPGKIEVRNMQCFSPAPPRPEHRHWQASAAPRRDAQHE